MQDLVASTWFFFLMFLSLCLWIFSILVFTHTSVEYIEKKMVEEEGVDAPEWDKGIGSRCFMYAFVLTFNLGIDFESYFIDNKLIIKHARKIDRRIAILLAVSSIEMFILGFFVYFTQ